MILTTVFFQQILFFLNVFYVYSFLPACMSVHAWYHVGQMRVLEHLKLELKQLWNATWVVGIVRVASAFNH